MHCARMHCARTQAHIHIHTHCVAVVNARAVITLGKDMVFRDYVQVRGGREMKR